MKAALAAGAFALLQPLYAATASAPFGVTVVFTSGPACSSQAPAHCTLPGTVPALTSVPNQAMGLLAKGSQLASELSVLFVGAGTITGWRVVNNDGHEYLEVTLGW